MSPSICIVGVALLILILPGNDALPQVTINPSNALIKPGEDFTLTCNSNVALTGCQFMRYVNGTLIDLNQGAKSKPPAGFTYVGSGLDKGHCGVKMANVTNWFIISCRVRAQQGGWVYKHMTLDVNSYGALSVHADPPGDVVVLPGQSLRFMYRLVKPTRHALSTCYISINGKWVYINETTPKTSVYEYYGDGLQYGECGIHVFSIDESYNRIMDVWMHNVSKPISGGFHTRVAITVAKPPTITFAVSSITTLTEGDTLTASCSARNSRPVANITWFLGNEQIRSDQEDDAPVHAEWRWPYDLQSLTQKISRPVKIEDSGKVLQCLVQHVGIKNQGGVAIKSAGIFVQRKDSKRAGKLHQAASLAPETDKEKASTDFSSNVTPSEVSSNVTPNEVSSNVTPSEVSSNVTPSEVSSSVTPSEVSSNVTPSEVSSSETPNEVSSSVTPN